MTRTRRTTRTRTALYQRDPAGLTGATARLADGRLVHFGPDLGNLLLVETPGVTGYELALPGDEQHPAISEWQRVIESVQPRRMTVSQRAAWERAAATVTTTTDPGCPHDQILAYTEDDQRYHACQRCGVIWPLDAAGTWTATIDGLPGLAEATATGTTPEEAVATLDAQTRCFDPHGEPLMVVAKDGKLWVGQKWQHVILGRVTRS